MRLNFKHIKSVYADALRLTNTLYRADQPIGEAAMCRFLGGGKVLHYEHKGTRETCIVSRIAATEITIIAGPQGSGKSRMARDMAAAARQPLWHTYAWLEGSEYRVPEGTDLVVIDEFPACGRFDRLLFGFISDITGEVLPVHVICCVQVALDGFEPKFMLGDKRLGSHPVEYIDLQKQSAS